MPRILTDQLLRMEDSQQFKVFLGSRSYIDDLLEFANRRAIDFMGRFFHLIYLPRQMPEYPDVELYLHALRHHIVGQEIRRVVIKSPFVLRTFEIDISEVHGRQVRAVSRIGKRIVWHLDKGLYLVFHLMITGRYHKRKAGALPRSKPDLAAFHFPDFTLMLTEAASKKRASMHLVRGASDLGQFERGGLDVMQCSLDEFTVRLRAQNRTIKITLIDPATFEGIGNAYSDEILHAARMSPFARTGKMPDDDIQRLFAAVQETLATWRDRLIQQSGDKFPERVTAFRPEMAVHGKFGEACPDCQNPVQRIVFAEKEWNYCAGCQTGGKLLADRSLSRLLKDEWPKSLSESE